MAKDMSNAERGREAGKSMDQKVGNWFKSLGDKVTDTVDNVQQWGEDRVNDVKEGVNNAKESVENAIDSAQQWSEDRVNDVKDFANDTKDAAESAWKATTEKAAEVADKAEYAAHHPFETLGYIGGTAQDYAIAVGEKIQDGVEVASNNIQNAKDGIAAGYKDMESDFFSALSNWSDKRAEAAKDKSNEHNEAIAARNERMASAATVNIQRESSGAELQMD